MGLVQFFNPFYKAPSAYEMAITDLAEAERNLLEAKAAAELQAKHVEYLTNLTARLQRYVAANVPK